MSVVYLARANPLRTCLGCGNRAPQTQLLRLHALADGTIDADVECRSAGRGAYLCLRVECLWEARKKNRFARALRLQGRPMEETVLGARIAQRLGDRLLRRLHTARREGTALPWLGEQARLGETANLEAARLLVLAEGVSAPPGLSLPMLHTSVVQEGSRTGLALAMQVPGAQGALVFDPGLATALTALAAARTDFLRTPPPRPRQGKARQDKDAPRGGRPSGATGPRSTASGSGENTSGSGERRTPGEPTKALGVAAW